MVQTFAENFLGRFIAPISLAGLIAFCGFAAQAEEKAERVLAIGGAVTEIVFELGEQDRLVGRDSTSVYPPEASALPDVGYIRRLSPEGVLSVKPDLILARENNGPPEAVEVLKSTGVKWVDVPDNFTVEGIDENVRIIATALGVVDKGNALRARISKDLAATSEKISQIKEPVKAMFILSLRDGKVMASGDKTGASGIMGLAGAENAVKGFDGYKQLSNEAVITAAPDFIIMMKPRNAAASDHSAQDDEMKAHAALSQTPAIKNGNIIRVDGSKMLGFGPRTGEAALELARLFYGNALD